VVRHAGNSVVAFGPQCTHLGCAYHWEESQNEFLCPCHDSLFSLDGAVLSGPARRPLDRYDTKTEGTELLLGRLRRSTGQAS
jgi:menaquinol-cytochrome c reductase iron-sulfur subunit